MWQTPPPELTLDPRAVHVWRISLEQPSESSDQFDSILSKAERTRADRLHFESDRLRYIISHYALRDIPRCHLSSAGRQTEIRRRCQRQARHRRTAIQPYPYR